MAEPLQSGEATRRGIRSFMLRETRLTAAQRRALKAHWPRYGVAVDGLLDMDALFGRRATRTLEIGFGNGDNLLAMATAEPHNDFLGIEVHRPGIGRLLHLAAAAGLTNLKVIRADAVEVLREHVADRTFDRVLILCPDPWPKHRHHKRRLLSPSFVATLADKMRAAGTLYLATDWSEYAEWMCGGGERRRSL